MLEVATVLNGNVLSAKSCQFFFDLVPRRGIVAVNYEEQLECEDVYDDSRDGAPVGTTYGRYSVSAFSITMLKTRWAELMPILALKGLGSLGVARFGFAAEYSEPLDPLHTLVDTMSFCRIVKIGDDYSEDIKA